MCYKCHFLQQIVAAPLKLQNKKQVYSLFYHLDMYFEKRSKMTIFMRAESRKV